MKTGKAPENAMIVFDQIAERVPAGSDRVIFAPWLYGERTPIEDLTVRGGFFNVSLSTKREHLIRGVMEGVAYNLALAIARRGRIYPSPLRSGEHDRRRCAG